MAQRAQREAESLQASKNQLAPRSSRTSSLWRSTPPKSRDARAARLDARTGRSPCCDASPSRDGSASLRPSARPARGVGTSERERRERSRDTKPCQAPAEGGAKHAVDGGRAALPFRDLGAELSAPFGGDAVVACAPIVLAGAPFGADPSAAQHRLQRWIERPLVDVEDVVRDLAQPEREPPSVHGLGARSLSASISRVPRTTSARCVVGWSVAMIFWFPTGVFF